jgi:hypothetical protein
MAYRCLEEITGFHMVFLLLLFEESIIGFSVHLHLHSSAFCFWHVVLWGTLAAKGLKTLCQLKILCSRPTEHVMTNVNNEAGKRRGLF